MIGKQVSVSRWMHRLLPVALIATMAMALGACVTTTDGLEAEVEPKLRVIGSVTYRERIALSPDSVVTVSLEDISLADRASERVVEQVVATGGGQVPFQFALIVDADELDRRHRYAVRATIHDGHGTLMWTTDRVHAVDPVAATTDLGELVLVRVAAR